MGISWPRMALLSFPVADRLCITTKPITTSRYVRRFLRVFLFWSIFFIPATSDFLLNLLTQQSRGLDEQDQN